MTALSLFRTLVRADVAFAADGFSLRAFFFFRTKRISESVFLQSPCSKRPPDSERREDHARSTFLRSVFSECFSKACWSLALDALRPPSCFFCRLKAFRRHTQLSYVSSSADTLSARPIVLSCG